jgi:hypothetical protein
MAKGKGKAKIKGLMNKIKSLPKKALGAVEETPFLPLLPFKMVMKNELEKKGVAHTNFLHDIVPKFAKSIAGLHFADFGADHDGQGYNLGEGVAISIVTTVINYLKNLHAKKAAGAPMTETEKKVLDESDKVSEQIAMGVIPPHMEGLGLENAPGNAVFGIDLKSMILTPKGLLATVGVLLGFGFIYKLLTRK